LALTVGIAATGFCYLGGILQLFIDKINKFCGYQQQHQSIRSLHQIHQSSSTARLHLLLRRVQVYRQQATAADSLPRVVFSPEANFMLIRSLSVGKLTKGKRGANQIGLVKRQACPDLHRINPSSVLLTPTRKLTGSDQLYPRPKQYSIERRKF
jgi:hypothetical protein